MNLIELLRAGPDFKDQESIDKYHTFVALWVLPELEPMLKEFFTVDLKWAANTAIDQYGWYAKKEEPRTKRLYRAKETIRRYAKRGSIPGAISVGQSFVFDRENLIQWLDDKELRKIAIVQKRKERYKRKRPDRSLIEKTPHSIRSLILVTVPKNVDATQDDVIDYMENVWGEPVVTRTLFKFIETFKIWYKANKNLEVARQEIERLRVEKPIVTPPPPPKQPLPPIPYTDLLEGLSDKLIKMVMVNIPDRLQTNEQSMIQFLETIWREPVTTRNVRSLADEFESWYKAQ